MSEPLISVIVPVYNVEPYLDRCVESIVNQTYRNLEIILVDDGSPDNCPQMCDAWAERDARIKVIHKENGGGAQARNVGLDTAYGEYIAFIDSDDFIFPVMYEKLLETILENKCDIAECGYTEVASDNFPAVKALEEPVRFFNAEGALRENINDIICRQLVWNKLYRRDAIGNIRFTEGKFIDDEFFTYQVLGDAKRIAVIYDPLYCYRQQVDSVMHQSYSLKRLDALVAKLLRVRYAEARYPSLAGAARSNLWFSGIYATQMALRYLPKLERAEACRKINEILRECSREFDGVMLPFTQRIWLMLAQISLRGTCWLRNKLHIGI